MVDYADLEALELEKIPKIPKNSTKKIFSGVDSGKFGTKIGLKFSELKRLKEIFRNLTRMILELGCRDDNKHSKNQK